VNSEFAASIPHGAVVLDAGAGKAPYRDLFTHSQYETADFEQVDKEYAPSTYVCDLSSIPVEDARFDYILFNQVMEHLPEPSKALTELYRVLKPGGKMLYSAPLCFHEHEQPYDFYRYTRYGVNHLFTQAGFQFDSLEWLESYFTTTGYHLNCMAAFLPRWPSELQMGIWNWVLFPIILTFRIFCKLFAAFFNQLDLRSDYDKRGYPKNYFAIVTKPIADGSKDNHPSDSINQLHMDSVGVRRRHEFVVAR
jgi:SAM-dependent methyltransferase